MPTPPSLVNETPSLAYITQTSLSRRLSQNLPIESRALFRSAGKTWACCAASGSCGKGNSAVLVDCIVSKLGSLADMPCSVGNFLTQGLSGPMKWLVQPESAMAQQLSDGLRAGTKVLQ